MGEDRGEGTDAGPGRAGSRWGRIEQAASRLHDIRSITISLFLFALAILITVAVIRELQRDIILVEPISVPKGLVDQGYTPEVVARRLIDEAGVIQSHAVSMKEKREVDTDWTEADLKVPGSEFSVESIIGHLRPLISSKQTLIGGEITREGDNFRLRLRSKDGQNTPESWDSGAFTSLDDLLRKGGQDFVMATDPYMLAFYFRGRDPERAKRIIDYCLTREPKEDDVWAQNLLGVIHLSKGSDESLDRAIASIDAALDIDPDFAAAHVNWGLAHMMKRDYKAAQERFEMVTTSSPEYGLAHAALGFSLAKEGDFEKALKKFKEASKISPDQPRVYLYWGRALTSRQGDREATEEAIRQFKKAIALSPKFAEAHFMMGEAYRGLNKHEASVEAFRNATRLNPSSYSKHLALALRIAGDNLLIDGEFAAAKERFEEALPIAPGDMRRYLKDKLDFIGKKLSKPEGQVSNP